LLGDASDIHDVPGSIVIRFAMGAAI